MAVRHLTVSVGGKKREGTYPAPPPYANKRSLPHAGCGGRGEIYDGCDDGESWGKVEDARGGEKVV